MDLATQNHLKPLRDWLEYRLHELQHEVPPLPPTRCSAMSTTATAASPIR